MKIFNKTVLITGGASGIGRLMGKMALQKGAKCLVIWDINDNNLASAKEEFSTLGTVYAYKVDISSPESIDAACAQTGRDCGTVDILINCAGIITNNKRFFEQDDTDVQRTVNINTSGAMLVTLRFIKDMVARNDGHICNVTSSAGMLALPRMALYSASKWASIGWSESITLELEEMHSKVKVTTIAPYFINTGMFDGIKSFFRIRKPEEVAAKTLRAIERDTRYRGIPFSSHFIRLMQGIFPYRLFNFVFGHVCGLYTVMNSFRGRANS